MSEPEIPKITEVKPEDFPEILEQLKSLGAFTESDSYYPFELSIKLTDDRQVDISVKWDGDQGNSRDIATILDSLTNGYLDQQIVLALKLISQKDKNILDGVKRLLRKWMRLRDEREDSPFVDSFQPLMPQQRGN